MQKLKNTTLNEVCVCNRVILYASWSDFNITKKQLDRHLIEGHNKSHVISCSSEYVCYCVKLSLLKRYCYFMSRRKKLNTKMCDVVFASILVVLCKTGLSDDNEWLYAYNQTNSHSRLCQEYGVNYYVQTYDEKLFDDLASEFKFQWMDRYPKGCSFVYSAKSHKDILQN